MLMQHALGLEGKAKDVLVRGGLGILQAYRLPAAGPKLTLTKQGSQGTAIKALILVLHI